jgi:hypothetical protein
MPSWRPDSPVELPNGRLVCKRHGLVRCGICTVDYSFMDEILGDEESLADFEGYRDNFSPVSACQRALGGI